MYDAYRYGGVWSSRAHLFDIGYAEDDEHPAVVVFITRSLVVVGDVGQEIVRNPVSLFELPSVFFCRAGDLYPAVRLPSVYFLQLAVGVPIRSHSCKPVFF